jgi:anti-sigma regulatory factor (Ser/Thr protein kinase)
MDPVPTPLLENNVLSEHVHLQIPSQPEWITPTVEYLKERAILCGACQESRADKVLLALHEALTNSVIHGNLEVSSALKESVDNSFAETVARRTRDPEYGERPVDIEIRYDGTRCQWIITDQGPGFDVEAVHRQARKNANPLVLASGRGLLLMHAFMDEVRYEQQGRQVFLTLARESGTERRQHPRHVFRQPVRIAPIQSDGTVDWEAAHQALSRDVSTVGIGVLQAELETTPRVLVSLDWRGKVLSLPAEVRHCQEVDDLVELGCRFQLTPSARRTPAEEPTAAQRRAASVVGEFLEKMRGQEVPANERRLFPRVLFSETIDIYPGESDCPLRGYARDLSRGGVAFLSSTPFDHVPVLISLPRGESDPLQLRARILRCHRLMEGVYEVGARFVDVLEPEVRGQRTENGDQRSEIRGNQLPASDL